MRRLLFAVAILLTTCPLIFSQTMNSLSATNRMSLDGKWHSIEIAPSTNHAPIHTYEKFNPVWWFENCDDPTPPDWYRPGQEHRVGLWHFRNPLHNFDFYVIGVADKETERSGRYPDKISNPHSGWNFAVTRRRIIFLPYVCYQRSKFEFYLGWRKGGNFGVKFNVSDTNEKAPAKTANGHT